MAIFFAQKLRYFRANFFCCEFLRMKRNEFCTNLRIFFCTNCAKPEIFFCEFLRMKRKEFYAIFFAQFAQNRKYYAKRNFFVQIDEIWNFIHRIKQLKIYSTITYKKIINKKVCLNYSQFVTFFYILFK